MSEHGPPGAARRDRQARDAERYNPEIPNGSEMTTRRVLFVCLGNICRSPMAEALFRHRSGQASRSSEFEIDSAGTPQLGGGGPPRPPPRRHAAPPGGN